MADTFHNRLAKDISHKIVGTTYTLKEVVIKKAQEVCLPCADTIIEEINDEYTKVKFYLGNISLDFIFQWEKRKNGMYRLVKVW